MAEPLTGEALESDEAAASENIFLRTVVGVGVTVGVAVTVPVAVAVAVAVAVGVGVGVPQGLTGQLKISIEASR